MKRFTEQMRLQHLKKLQDEYSLGGREALASWRPGEVIMFAGELQMELSYVSRRVNQQPNELGIYRKAKLEATLADVHGWMEEHKEQFRRGPDMER